MSDEGAPTAPPSRWTRIQPWAAAAGAVACFHAAYTIPHAAFLVLGYAAGLLVFARSASPRQAFYGGVAVGLATVAPWLWFFTTIFGVFGVVLWVVVGIWTCVFTVLARAAYARLRPWQAALLVPFLWTGVEYFRCELYLLRFAWVTPGFAFWEGHARGAPLVLGVYGAGFTAMVLAAIALTMPKWRWLRSSYLVLVGMLLIGSPRVWLPLRGTESTKPLRVAGLQFEGADTEKLPARLDALLAEHPDTDLVVLPEYSFSGPVPEGVLDWCRRNRKHLVAGGKDLISKDDYYNTAFVIGPDGKEVFRQVKSVPIQFFADGKPAPKQELWESPWGKIGICICYDLSFTRVVDRLVAMGAQVIVVPTMDARHWGERQHLLHARVAPVRAQEYGVPIVRVCSSGISQIVDCRGEVIATAPFPGPWASVAAEVHPVGRGRLPPDRRLAPFATAVAAAWAAWLLVGVVRRKKSQPL